MHPLSRTAPVLALLLLAARPATADLVHCERPLVAPAPTNTPAGSNLGFTVIRNGTFDPDKVDPSFGDDSFTYYLDVGPGTVKYAWEQGPTQGNDSCDLDRKVTFQTTYEKSYTRTSSTEIQTSLTSTLGKADVASIGSSVGVTTGVSDSFTAGVMVSISDEVTIPPCTTVTWWHLYKTTQFEFTQFRQIDNLGYWGFQDIRGTITVREYQQSTITSVTGKCVPAPAGAVLAAVAAGLFAVRRRRSRAALTAS